ncbi:hypothetical protein [Arthrobacter sp. H14-L1]|uniref:hypothetical protein n=1 Tax=Arthrobacter sp. H14-L1 TaxID=2996697 RepID=UPI002270B8BA|nr:hypothetical protein [Arthrobacter sp. H14-L1]MCY0906589.1 hypothetical protein [Arthrobacter sp. H14-L1]
MSRTAVWRNYFMRSRRMWFLLMILATVLALVLALFLTPGHTGSPQTAVEPTPAASQTATSQTASGTAPGPAVEPTVSPTDVAVSPGEPRTLNFRAYAEATAEALYIWDSRTSTYTQVYEHIRSWWMVLADGSNPLTVYTQEFEGTGINAAAFAQLSTYRAYRTAAVVQTSCDNSLAQVRDHPAPWVGLHVCTIVLNVTDRSTTDPHAGPYRVPVSVMVNCPPARTAPADRCVLAGFETTAGRIVY